MKHKLLELNGIDNFKNYSFKWILEDQVEGFIDFNDKKLLGATISKEIIDNKVISSFEDINIDKLEIFNNIFICNVKFNLSIEYSENSSFGKINLLNNIFYKTFFTSLKDYNFSNIDNEVLVIDLDLIQNENNLYYFADIIIGINEL